MAVTEPSSGEASDSDPPVRKIIHVDADSFYASVEERDDPSLIGKPVVVGGRPDGRGVIATANYLARGYGVRSAMPSAQALRLCPDLTFLRPDMAKYREASEGMHRVFQRYTKIIEPLSLDEAYLDVSESQRYQGSATRMAQAIKAEVFNEVGIRVSAGVSVNKFLAKVASDWEKPDGLTVLTPDQIQDFVGQLPVRKFPGVGPKLAEKLAADGFQHGQDLLRLSRRDWVKGFGAMGERLYHLARGVDQRAVKSQRTRKSVSVENTYGDDLPDLEHCQAQLPSLLVKLEERMQSHADRVRGVFVKVKFADFSQTTAEGPLIIDLSNSALHYLAEAYDRNPSPVRLLGVGVRLGPLEWGAQIELELSERNL